MPANSFLGQRAIVRDVIAAAAFDYARTDTWAMLSQIPNGGTTLTFPANPEAGDFYDFADVDGTCSATDTITIQAADGALLNGNATLTFSKAFTFGRAVFDGATGAWAVSAGADAGITPPAPPNRVVSARNAAVVNLTGVVTAAATTPALAVPTGASVLVNVSADFISTDGAAQEAEIQIWVDGAAGGAPNDDPVCSELVDITGAALLSRAFVMTGLAAGNHTFSVAVAFGGAGTIPANAAVVSAVCIPQGAF